ncbi:MAG TPA: HAD family phosphatase [Ktedonobacterales bacterium]
MANNGNVPTPRVIVLDIGNVLVGLDWSRPAARIKRLFPQAVDPAGAFRKLDGPSARYGLGLITTEEFLAQARQELGLELDQATFISLWNDIFVERPYMLPFLRELREQGHMLAICSNTNALHIEFLETFSACFAEIHHPIYSHVAHVYKPDLAIYRAVEAATGQSAAEHLFLDDLPENVAGARAAGWDGICFETPEQVQQELIARGIRFTPWKQ